MQWEQDIGEQVCLRDYLFQSDSIFISRVGAVKPSTGQHSNTEVELDQEEEKRREEIRQEMEDKEREAELVARLANQSTRSSCTSSRIICLSSFMKEDNSVIAMCQYGNSLWDNHIIGYVLSFRDLRHSIVPG